MLISNKIILMRNILSGFFVFLMASFAMADTLDDSIVIEINTINESAESQKKIDRFAEQTQDLSSQYKSTLLIIEQYQNYNNQLELLIESQEKEMVSIQNQMDSIDATERGVAPLMNEMIVSLEKFIELDLPFELEKRENRVNDLKNMMIRADVSTSDKYRRILEAYQNEIAYGEFGKTYQGIVNQNGIDVKVDFVSIGRVLLAYLTLDGHNAGFYNTATRKYEPLDDQYIRGLELAIKIFNKQAASELIKLPIPAAQGTN